MKVLPAKAAAEKAGLSLRTLYSEVSELRFPQPIQLTARRVGWLEDEIDRWIAERVARRDRYEGAGT